MAGLNKDVQISTIPALYPKASFGIQKNNENVPTVNMKKSCRVQDLHCPHLDFFCPLSGATEHPGTILHVPGYQV